MKLIVMGVSGSGKSTLAAALAGALRARFLDADDLHPPASIAHMAAGKPLTDDMRWPWLDDCGKAMAQAGPVVLACSALKRAYRDRLRAAVPGVRFIYPHLSRAEVVARMAAREGHFMPASLLDSQFDALEDPSGEADVITLPGDQEVAALVRLCQAQLSG